MSLIKDAKLFDLHTGRNVPLSLHSKVQDEFNWMESLGVVYSVCDSAPWCTSMVTSVKLLLTLVTCLTIQGNDC